MNNVPCAYRHIYFHSPVGEWRMLTQGFEPWSSARKADMIGRATPSERRHNVGYGGV